MADRDFSDYLDDILNEIDFLEKYVPGSSVDDLENDDLKYRSILKSLEIIGESSKKIPYPLKRKYSKIPWNRLSDIRNELTHEYFSVDFKRIVDMITDRLIPLKGEFKKLLDEVDR